MGDDLNGSCCFISARSDKHLMSTVQCVFPSSVVGVYSHGLPCFCVLELQSMSRGHVEISAECDVQQTLKRFVLNQSSLEFSARGCWDAAEFRAKKCR